MSGTQRWAISFADLLMLLLGLFVILHARGIDDRAVAASTRAALGGPPPAAPALDGPAAPLFAPGEARLTDGARMRLRAIGAHAREGRVELVSTGRAGGGARFDAWELAAARAAAAARALSDGGVAADRVRLSMGTGDGPQRLTITIR